MRPVTFLIFSLYANFLLSLGAVTFTDVTSEIGLDFKHTDGRSGRFYFLEELGSGAAFFDYDNDNDLDIYFVNGSNLPGHNSAKRPINQLYQNDGRGKFTDVTLQAGVGDLGYGVGCCVGDYNNDGYLDLYVTNYGNNVLYQNNGNGTFADVTDQANVGDSRWGSGCAFADYDNDGDLDLYVANYVQFDFEKHKTCRFNDVETYCQPQDFQGESDLLYQNNGNGTFTDVTQEAGVYNSRGRGLGVVWGDYDNDKDPDIYDANDTNDNYLYQNNGHGKFTNVAFYAGVALGENGEMGSGMGTDFGDFNNDGFLDLIVTNFQDEVAILYKNEGNGFFSDITYISGMGEKTLSTLGWGTTFFDYDNDGDKDLFIANGHVCDNINQIYPEKTYPQTNQLFENLGNEVFREVATFIGSGSHQKTSSRGATFGDYDNDGDIDILITNSNRKAQFLRNDGGNQKNWIKVQIIGETSNRSGVGTRVEVTCKDLVQIAEVKSGASYLCQNDFILHFGLDGYDAIDKIIATFANGSICEIKQVSVNQTIQIFESGKSKTL
ncbi:TPA: CRTAC1 family protein [Candidatus Poribacteria bacterium]|nr:CRTAC1 family protein [Candidatus Poribacteria bacterium]